MVLHALLPGHADPAWQQAALERLPYGKRLELERRDDVSRVAGLCAIELVLQGAAAITSRRFQAAELRFPQGGKPVFSRGPHFSVSHSLRRVAVALSARFELGLDLEDRVAGTQAELARLREWTAREAVLKAAGAGIRDLRRVQLAPEGTGATLDEVGYRLLQAGLGDDAVCRLAIPSAVQEHVVIELREVRLPPAD